MAAVAAVERFGSSLEKVLESLMVVAAVGITSEEMRPRRG
jgi:hypothetical protein